MLAFGVLVFVVGTLVVANAWAVVDAKFAADSAARQGARTYVETGRSGAEAEGPAVASAMATLASLHRDTGAVVFPVAGGYGRCARITFRVSTPVPVFHLPWVGSAGPGFTVTAIHSELVDPYRSGLPGEAVC